MSEDADDILVKKLTGEEIRTALERGLARRKAEKRAERERQRERDEPTGVQCRVCGAEIVNRLRHPEPRPFDMNTPIGRLGPRDPDDPGPRAYSRGFHCSGCGIEYHKPMKVSDSGQSTPEGT
jgi:hypothetical protein